MQEEIWFIMIVWVFTIILSLKTKNAFFAVIASMFSFLLGFVTLESFDSPSSWFGVLIFITGIYLLYSALFKYLKSGGKSK